MDYKFYPIIRKIPLDRIQIPFFSNNLNYRLADFVKNLYKYRCILEEFYEKYVEIEMNSRKQKYECLGFVTQVTPKKSKT